MNWKSRLNHYPLIGILVLSLRAILCEDAPLVYSSYRTLPGCNPATYFRYPKTEQDVVEIVKEAIAKNLTVKAFGARHSQTDIICTDGIPIDNQGLQFYQMNDDGVTATFGSGVNLREASTFLRKFNRGFKTTPAYGNITIGGATGTGSHGSTIKYNSSLSSQVVGMRIVDGMGEIQDICEPEDLHAFRVHLGLLGIILKVTLYTVPLYKTKATNYRVSEDILTNGEAIKMANSVDQLSLYWFPEFSEVIVANWTIVDAETQGNAYTYDHVPSIYRETSLVVAAAGEAAFSLTSSACTLANAIGYTIAYALSYITDLALQVDLPFWVPIYTEDGLTVKMPAVGYYDVMFAPVCYDEPQGFLGEACVWDHGPNNVTLLDNELGVELSDLPKFIEEIKNIRTKAPTVFPLQGILMRFSDKDETYMSNSYGRQSVHFEFYLWNRKDMYKQPPCSLAGYQTILQLLRNKYSARSHWGKSGLAYHNSESLDLKLDPLARGKFIEAMNRSDPNGVFMNSFGRRIKKTGTKVDFDPKVERCALLDNCFCVKNGDCGDSQTCTTLPGYSYNVCKTKNEAPIDFFPKIILPNSTGLFGFLGTEAIQIAKALTGECTLPSLLATIGDTGGNTLSQFIRGLGGEIHELGQGAINNGFNVIKKILPGRAPVMYSSYRTLPGCNPATYFRYPKTEQDVVEIVKEAIAKNLTVKAFGARHSQTDIICTDGIPIDNQGLQFYQMNDDGVTATFGSGVNLREASTFLRKFNRGFKTTPAYGNITIGGATGTGSHGSTIKYNSSLSSQVVGMRIVDGMGEIQDICEPEDLHAFRVHLGLLGIILKVTLYTVPLYKTKATNYRVSEDILTNGEAIKMANSVDQLSLYWFPEFSEVIVANWTIVDAETQGNAYTYDHVPSIYRETSLVVAAAGEAAFSLTSSACTLANAIGYTIAYAISYFTDLALQVDLPFWVPIYTEDGLTVKMPAVGYYDVMFAPVCYDEPQGFLGEACVWDHGPNNVTILDNDLGVELSDLPKFIEEIKDIRTKAPTVFPLQGILMRFSDKDETYMSNSYGRQSVHFEFYLWNRKDMYKQPPCSLAGYQTILQLLRNKYSARSHWGKSGLAYHNSESLDLKLDPLARGKFIEAMNRSDPNGVFMNSFGRRIKKTGTKVDFDPKVERCALLDNCFCVKNGDCGDSQTCTTLPGYSYNVCKTKNETPIDFFPKIILPNSTGLFGFLGTEAIQIAKALTGECTLPSLLATIGDTGGNTLSQFIRGLGGEIHELGQGAINNGFNVIKKILPGRVVELMKYKGDDRHPVDARGAWYSN